MNAPESGASMNRRQRVLFLCTGNSARSQIAEALMRHIAGGEYEVVSAGTHPRDAVHPLALRTLEKHHIHTSGLHPKDIAAFAGQSFDYVITVCDRALEQCPIFTGAEMIHWSFSDPVAADPSAQWRAFNAVFNGLSQRIRLLIAIDEKKPR